MGTGGDDSKKEALTLSGLTQKLLPPILGLILMVGGWFCSHLYDRVEHLNDKVIKLETKIEDQDKTLDRITDLIVDELKK
jgi:hypothetical protein